MPRGSRSLRTLLGAAVGAAAGFGIGLGAGLAVVQAAQVSARDGESAVMVAFLFVAPGTLVGLVVGAIVAFRRSGRPDVSVGA